jgi:hypothetical protein
MAEAKLCEEGESCMPQKKNYDPSKTLPELIDEVLDDLSQSVRQGDETCLKPLQDINGLMLYLFYELDELFLNQLYLFNTSVSYHRYGGRSIELYLSFRPSVNQMPLALLFYDSTRVYKRPFGIMQKKYIGSQRCFSHVEVAANSPFGTVPVKDLSPYLCAHFWEDIEDDLKTLDVVMNYINSLPVSRQSELVECSQTLFPPPGEVIKFQGVTLSRLMEPVWHQSLCDELAALKAAALKAKDQ